MLDLTTVHKRMLKNAMAAIYITHITLYWPTIYSVNQISHSAILLDASPSAFNQTPSSDELKSSSSRGHGHSGKLQVLRMLREADCKYRALAHNNVEIEDI